MVSPLIYTGGIDFFLIHKPKLFTQREINISQRLFPLFTHPQVLRSVMDCPLQEVYMQKQNLLTCNANTIARAVPRTSAADDIWLPVGPFRCEPQSDLGWHVRHTLLLNVVDQSLCPWNIISQLQRKISHWCTEQMFVRKHIHTPAALQVTQQNRSNTYQLHPNISAVKVLSVHFSSRLYL